MTGTGAQPTFSVVIPTYQRRDVVLETVKALATQKDAPPFEVIVVVDGSTDGTAAALRELETPFELTVIEQENHGRSAACNRGAHVARGAILLFLDDDMEADPRLIAEHARSQREGADAVLGDIPLHPDSPAGFLAQSVGEWAERRARELAARGGRHEATDFVTGQTSIRRELFLRAGGFDLGFTRRGRFGGEDFDLGLRLASKGCRAVFNPLAISRQRYVVTPSQHLRQWHDAGRARVMLARKHPEHMSDLLSRRERLADRIFWRHLRRPLRKAILAVLGVGEPGERRIEWFRRVRDLEFFAGVRAAGGLPKPRSLRVLCYHSIADLRDASVLEQYGVPPAQFRRQLRLLARFFHFVDAGEFQRSLAGAGLPRRPVLITFDDCTSDLLDVALPLLREHDAPALAFAVTGLFGGTNEWDRKLDAPELPLLDADGLRELAANGIAVGTHTRTHAMLDGLPADEMQCEIEGSIGDLEAAGLGRASFLAYPHGAHDTQVERAAANAGLAGAFGTAPGLVQPGGNSYALPRIEIFRADSGAWFALKLLTGGRPRRRQKPRLYSRFHAVFGQDASRVDIP